MVYTLGNTSQDPDTGDYYTVNETRLLNTCS